MPSHFKLSPEVGLCYIRHHGYVTMDECIGSMTDFINTPGPKTGLRFVVDFRYATDFERDYARIMQMQLTMTDVLNISQGETLLVLLAGSEVSHAMAQPLYQYWADSPHVIPRLYEAEADALNFLGLPGDQCLEIFDIAET